MKWSNGQSQQAPLCRGMLYGRAAATPPKHDSEKKNIMKITNDQRESLPGSGARELYELIEFNVITYTDHCTVFLVLSLKSENIFFQNKASAVNTGRKVNYCDYSGPCANAYSSDINYS